MNRTLLEGRVGIPYELFVGGKEPATRSSVKLGCMDFTTPRFNRYISKAFDIFQAVTDKLRTLHLLHGGNFHLKARTRDRSITTALEVDTCAFCNLQQSIEKLYLFTWKSLFRCRI